MLNVSSNVLDKLRNYFHKQQRVDKAVDIDVVILDMLEGLIVAIDKNNPKAKPYELLTAYASHNWQILTADKEIELFLNEAINECRNQSLGILREEKSLLILRTIKKKISTLDIERD